MSRQRRLLAGLTCATALLAAQAHAQPAPASPAPAPLPAPSAPETLETPYQDTPPPPPEGPASVPAPPPPGVVRIQVPAAPAVRPELPIRARRKLALTGELGWNGLAGFGPVLTYHADPHFSLDLGAGMSLLGWKVGARGRYNFMTTPFTPFLGVGFNATSGFGEVKIDPSEDPEGDPTRQPITLDVKPSYLLQGVLGFDFIHKHGFTLIGCLGYARLLNSENVKVVAGSLTHDEEQAINVLFRSGVVLSLGAGYAFE